MKVKIFSVHAKRTDFLRLHVETLNHFCQDHFEYYCIDNFVDQEKSLFIKNECDSLGVNYVRFNNYQITGTAWDHAPSLNSIKTIASDDDVNVILEFDIFLIKKFSFIEYIQNYDAAGLYQQRNNFDIEYFAPFIVIVNKKSSFSKLDFSGLPGCDVGGSTSLYIEQKNVRWMKHTSALFGPKDKNIFKIDYDCNFGCQVIEGSFIHYFRGTNWDNKPENHEQLKTTWLLNAIEKSKNGSIIDETHLQKYSTPFSHSFRFWNGSEEKFQTKLNPYLNEN